MFSSSKRRTLAADRRRRWCFFSSMRKRALFIVNSSRRSSRASFFSRASCQSFGRMLFSFTDWMALTSSRWAIFHLRAVAPFFQIWSASEYSASTVSAMPTSPEPAANIACPTSSRDSAIERPPSRNCSWLRLHPRRKESRVHPCSIRMIRSSFRDWFEESSNVPTLPRLRWQSSVSPL